MLKLFRSRVNISLFCRCKCPYITIISRIYIIYFFFLGEVTPAALAQGFFCALCIFFFIKCCFTAARKLDAMSPVPGFFAISNFFSDFVSFYDLLVFSHNCPSLRQTASCPFCDPHTEAPTIKIACCSASTSRRHSSTASPASLRSCQHFG